MPANAEFELRGVNHLALVCSDMAQTVRFYRDILGMPLVRTIDMPQGSGQHFFFDIGNGDSLAFFWFPGSPQAARGVSSPKALPGGGEIVTAHGSMNHIAFNVPAEKFDEYCARLKAKGVAVSPVLNHDDSPAQVSREVTDRVFVRSVYFFDPDGIMLEFACWTKAHGPADVSHDPVDARGEKQVGLVTSAEARALMPAS